MTEIPWGWKSPITCLLHPQLTRPPPFCVCLAYEWTWPFHPTVFHLILRGARDEDRRQKSTDLLSSLPVWTPDSIHSLLDQLRRKTSHQKISEQHLAELPSEIWWRICEKPRQCTGGWRIDWETLERMCWRQVVSHRDEGIEGIQNQDGKPTTTPTPRSCFYTPGTWRTCYHFPSTVSQVSPSVYKVLGRILSVLPTDKDKRKPI